MIKLIIAGSREFHSDEAWELLNKEVDEYISLLNDKDIEVISGGARGADSMGSTYAQNHEYPVKYFIPDWNGLGKKAGMVRNQEMAKYATHCIVFMVKEGSKGSQNMIANAKKYNLGLKVVLY